MRESVLVRADPNIIKGSITTALCRRKFFSFQLVLMYKDQAAGVILPPILILLQLVIYCSYGNDSSYDIREGKYASNHGAYAPHTAR